MKHMIYLLVILLLTPIKGNCSEWVKLSLMGFAQSKRIFHGAETWPSTTLIPGIAITLWDKLHIRGPQILYKSFNRQDQFQLDFGVRYFTDDEPLLEFSNHQPDHRNLRPDSIQSHILFKYKFGFRNLFNLGLKLEQELVRYKDYHFEVLAGAPILPFTSLKVNYAFAGKKSNQYSYGPEAVQGASYWGLGVMGVIPKLPWDGIIMVGYDNFWILQKENKNALYIQGNHHNSRLSTRIIWRF